MSYGYWKSAAIVLASSAAAFATIERVNSAGAAEQAATFSRQEITPNFSGVWRRTNPVTFLPIPGDELGDPIERLEVDSIDAPEIMAGNFRNAILQPWARDIVETNAEAEIRLEHVNTSDDTCWPLGVPQILNLREQVQILQAEDNVVIIYQRDHHIRRISLNQKHAAGTSRSWYGDSVGHYEGDTLVVDTINQLEHKMSVVDNYGTPHTERIHVVERYRLINDDQGVGLEVRFRVDDPGAFTIPWTGSVIYRPSPLDFAEVVCAENNRSFENGSVFGDMPQDSSPDF
jgi:hypothetical protein